MDNSQEIFELIEKYLNEELSQVDRLDFEKQISLDQELANEVEAHRITNKIILDYNLLKSKKNFAEWQRQNNSRPGLMALSGLIIVGFILSVVLFFVISDREHDSVSLQKEQNAQDELFDVESEFLIKEKENLPNNSSPEIVDKQAPESKEVLTQIWEVEKKNLKVEIPAVSISVKELINIEKIERATCTDTLSINSIKFQGSCKDDSNGFIQFLSEISGKEIIAYSIDKGVTFQNYSNFNFLKNDSYQPVLISSDGCFLVFDQSVILTEDDSCIDNLSFVIDMSQNQFWQPETEIKNANIQIRNSSGVVVYSSKLDEKFRWYGYGNNGQRLSMGEYLYIISSDDDKSTGNITIIR